MSDSEVSFAEMKKRVPKSVCNTERDAIERDERNTWTGCFPDPQGDTNICLLTWKVRL